MTDLTEFVDGRKDLAGETNGISVHVCIDGSDKESHLGYQVHRAKVVRLFPQVILETKTSPELCGHKYLGLTALVCPK